MELVKTEKYLGFIVNDSFNDEDYIGLDLWIPCVDCTCLLQNNSCYPLSWLVGLCVFNDTWSQ